MTLTHRIYWDTRWLALGRVHLSNRHVDVSGHSQLQFVAVEVLLHQYRIAIMRVYHRYGCFFPVSVNMTVITLRLTALALYRKPSN